ncbi:hypothetical protein G5B30_16695 [Sphingobacterium sp. SGG-5]|uniref:hypothetical protein n=1 Tax=Sphingobacterium sp. SGG-5 TaxID=2710881 RepID=UPI0013EC02DC|nr:hypothetical protein [Sphingobacterium sp. SGG-5]NGM63550.1 hypothetical protein [Sphingobacterium sp. SGG-5]
MERILDFIHRNIFFMGDAEREVVKEALETLFFGALILIGVVFMFYAPYLAHLIQK